MVEHNNYCDASDSGAHRWMQLAQLLGGADWRADRIDVSIEVCAYCGMATGVVPLSALADFHSPEYPGGLSEDSDLAEILRERAWEVRS